MILNKWHLVHTRIPCWSLVLFTRVHSSSFVEPESNTLSTLHKCNIHTLVRPSQSQSLRGDARWWKSAAVTEEMLKVELAGFGGFLDLNLPSPSGKTVDFGTDFPLIFFFFFFFLFLFLFLFFFGGAGTELFFGEERRNFHPKLSEHNFVPAVGLSAVLWSTRRTGGGPPHEPFDERSEWKCGVKPAPRNFRAELIASMSLWTTEFPTPH